MSGRRAIVARNNIEECCLARAVRPDQAGDRPFFNLETCAVYGTDAAKVQVYVVNFDHMEKSAELEENSPGRIRPSRSLKFRTCSA